jgi:hypothetical protein
MREPVEFEAEQSHRQDILAVDFILFPNLFDVITAA